MTPREPSTLLVLASTYPRWKDDHEPGFVHELAKRLAGRFRVIVLCPHAVGASEREILDGVEIIRYRYAPRSWETLVNDGGIVANLRANRWKYFLAPGFALAQAWHAWRICRREKVGIIHAHWLVPQGVVAALLQLMPGTNIPYLVTSHGADLHAVQGGVLNRLKRLVANRAAAVTVVSGAMKDKLRALGVGTAKISVLPMGVDMQERFSASGAESRSARELLFVGRLVEKKGLRHLLDAMPMVLRSLPDATLTIAGFGPEDGRLKAQAEALRLGSSVRFLGAVPQAGLPALYHHAALFVAPFIRAKSGDEEGLGLVLVEAIGCGCPILAGNVPALAEVLGDDFDDMAVDPLDATDLSNRIIKMLGDPIETNARAALLRKAIGERFDWKNVADEYARLLGSCMGITSK
ncbi:MAG: glycosyltransferase [Proteobacteria bacterium]|nr:glycosyltransferase [Pseudomonadota bacterium]MBS0216629.1 glycosyltransferase [Pseudomonadota bacterium]